MPAVRQNLLGKLPFENAQARVEPSLRLVALEEQPREDQRLGIGEQVIAQKMPFEPPSQIARLHGEAVRGGIEQGVSRAAPT